MSCQFFCEIKAEHTLLLYEDYHHIIRKTSTAGAYAFPKYGYSDRFRASISSARRAIAKTVQHR